MRNYKFAFCLLLLLQAAWAAAPATAAEEEVSFRLLNEDFEIMLELGAAFVQDPVFKADGANHPFVQVDYKQPRYVGVQLGWWFNDYLLIQWGVNFTSADFKTVRDIGGVGQFNNVFQNNFRYQHSGENSSALYTGGLNVDDICTAEVDGTTARRAINSIYCAARQPTITQYENEFLRTGQGSKYYNFFSLACGDACALESARTALTIDEAGNVLGLRSNAPNAYLIEITTNYDNEKEMIKNKVNELGAENICGESCLEQLTLLRFDNQRQGEMTTTGEYNKSYFAFLDGATEEDLARREVERDIENSKELCFGDCLETRIRARTQALIGQRGQTALGTLQGDARNTFIMGELEYTDPTQARAACDTRGAGSSDACLLVEAERLILARGDEDIRAAQTRATEALNAFIVSNNTTCTASSTDAELNACANTINTEAMTARTTAYTDWLGTRLPDTPEADRADALTAMLLRADTTGAEALDSEVCSALTTTAAKNACAVAALRVNDAGTLALNNIATNNQDDINDILRGIINLDALALNQPTHTLSAGGTFLSVGSFLNVYGSYPITRTFSVYGGGGIGVVWTKINEGFIERHAQINLDSLSSSDLDSISLLNPDTQARITTALNNLTYTQDTRRDISSSSLSYAFSFGAGFRQEVFEGLVLDIGYQAQWNPRLYRQSYAQWIHQTRVGFVFKF